MNDLYITTSIPYVNGAPHLGHALEFVHVDSLARHRRRRGAAVRTQSGTDDHAIKNVSAAEAAGVPVNELVAVNGDRFADLADALDVRTDEFLRTSKDPRHAAGVTALWQACEQAGDLYTQDYAGLYCPGCEQFTLPTNLPPACVSNTDCSRLRSPRPTGSSAFLDTGSRSPTSSPRGSSTSRPSRDATRCWASSPVRSTTCPYPGPRPERAAGESPCRVMTARSSTCGSTR
jgi:tRNA synthetases class I (M)